METIEETMSGNIGFGRRTSVTIIRNGDLATNLYLKVSIDAVTRANLNSATAKFAWVKRLGHALIKSVTVSIGGSQIDKQYSTWMDVWYELTHTEEQINGYAEMIGDVDDLTKLRVADKQSSSSSANDVFTPAYTMYIPLQFWFCRNTGLALPLIALQYHEVRLDFEFNNVADLYCYTGTSAPSVAPTMNDASLLVNYVYLDSEERRRFAQVGHEYLIEQVQFTGEESVATSTGATTTGKYKLGFNHPTKELIWAVKGGNYTAGNSFIYYDNEWNSASLNAAAKNLALSMFAITTVSTISAGSTTGTEGETTVVGGSYENATIDGTHTITTASSANNAQTCTVTVLTSEGIYYDYTTGRFQIGSSTRSGSYYLQICKNPLSGVSGCVTDVIVTVGYDATNNVPHVENVTVNANTLTVRDLSIPVNAQVDCRFNHGAVATDCTVMQQNNYGLLIDGTGNPISTALIQLNGQDRFDTMDGNYFNYVQPNQHHTHTPADGINVYSFALHPEQHQPSGSANLSRIDNTQLNLAFADSTYTSGLTQLTFWNSSTLLYVYAFSYNVLRIMSGMGGLAYSN